MRTSSSFSFHARRLLTYSNFFLFVLDIVKIEWERGAGSIKDSAQGFRLARGVCGELVCRLCWSRIESLRDWNRIEFRVDSVSSVKKCLVKFENCQISVRFHRRPPELFQRNLPRLVTLTSVAYSLWVLRKRAFPFRTMKMILGFLFSFSPFGKTKAFARFCRFYFIFSVKWKIDGEKWLNRRRLTKDIIQINREGKFINSLLRAAATRRVEISDIDFINFSHSSIVL